MLKQVKTTRKYLIVPISKDRKLQSVKIFYDQDQMTLKIPSTSPENADFTASYPLPGKENMIEADAEFFKYAAFADMPAAKDASMHQYFHLTAEQGWINDPNGLYFLNGEWHCFFQYNPFSSLWGNMHWDHAVSTDLLHWRELGIALYPDKDGYIYSGGAVMDTENVSGLGKDAILLYYTNANYSGIGTQNLAYSTDQGRSFRKYAGNPLVKNISGTCDRDPAPVYDPEEKIWYMPIYLGDEDKREFLLFTSTDLMHWQKSDSYMIPGGRECPGLRRMKDRHDGSWKWVFTEANCRYRIAEIHRGKIHFLTDSLRMLYGNAYAGQFYCNAPDARQIYAAWIRMPECPFWTWNGCISLAMEFSLNRNRLYVKPYAVPERAAGIEGANVPFEAVCKVGKSTSAMFRFGETEFHFDLPNCQLVIGDEVIPLPENFTGGRLFADCATAEFFDDAGTFAVCRYLPGNTDFAASGFDSVEYCKLKV